MKKIITLFNHATSGGVSLFADAKLQLTQGSVNAFYEEKC